MPQYIKKYNKKPLSLPPTGGSDQFPLENRIAALPAGQTLGHYTNGETIPFSTCTTLQDVLDLLCISTLYPSLVNPFIQGISLAGTGYGENVEVGTTITGFIVTVTFNRGSITPLYPEVPILNPPAGYRSGSITNYAFSNKITSPTNVGNVSPLQSIVVSAGTNQVDVLVSFAEGPQPRNSVGGITDANNVNYTPYPAGSIGGNASFQGKYRVFQGPSSIDHISGTVGVNAGARTLSSFLVTSGEFLLNPGLTLTEFYVYVPVSSGLSMVSAITTNFENISPSVVAGPGHYILISSTFEIPNADGNTMVLYKKYKMYNNIPYTDAGLRHKIVLG